MNTQMRCCYQQDIGNVALSVVTSTTSMVHSFNVVHRMTSAGAVVCADVSAAADKWTTTHPSNTSDAMAALMTYGGEPEKEVLVYLFSAICFPLGSKN